MTSQPINPQKPHQYVELVTLNKFAKFHYYTTNNKKVMMGREHFVPPPPLPGCNEPKKPGLDRVNIITGLCVKSQDEVNAVKFTMVIRFLGACVSSAIMF